MFRINGREFEASMSYGQGSVGASFATDMGYSEIEEMVRGAETVEITRGEDILIRYYVRSLASIAIADGVATVTLGVSVLGKDTAEELRGGVEDADAALVELAGLVVELEEQNAQLADRVTTLEILVRALASPAEEENDEAADPAEEE